MRYKKPEVYRWKRAKPGLFRKVGDDQDVWIAEVAKGAGGRWWGEYLAPVEHLPSVEGYILSRFRTLTEAKAVIDFKQRGLQCLS